MTFGDAVERLRWQYRVRRRSWPAGQWIARSPESTLPKHRITRDEKWIPNDRDLVVAEAIGLYDSTGVWHMSWTPTAQDLFAYDWEIFPPIPDPVDLIEGREC